MNAPPAATKQRAARASQGTGARRARRSAAGRLGELPRFLYTREESARVLGMSLSHFQRHVQPYIPCVYVGQLRQYRPEDLSSWAQRAATEPTCRSASRA
jgi:AraC-like DNA-binding protein